MFKVINTPFKIQSYSTFSLTLRTYLILLEYYRFALLKILILILDITNYFVYLIPTL